MALHGLIVACPVSADAVLHWWHVEDSHVVARGQDVSPPARAGDAPVIALVPAADTVIRTLDMGDMSAAQAEAAARYRAADLSIGGDLFVAVRALGRTEAGMRVRCATIARATLADHLAELALRGLDPDIIVPVGLLLPESDQPVSATFGDLGADRLGDLVLPPDEALGALLLAGEAPVALDQDRRDAALVAALADPPLNLRQGDFARRTPLFALGAGQGRTLAWLLGALALVSLAVPLAEIGKHYLGADLAERRALASAQRLVPGATDAAQAEQQIDARLAARGAGNMVASVPLAGLLSAIQPVPGVVIRQADYRPGGIIAAMIAAPRVEDLNTVLIALQNNGYKVTAANRSDATGQAVADITVLAP
ncbi:type II secretion system protein GspL [Sphingomonas sp. 35-24ZXX]|uniref:type II secretion system protein GspL n=1 Tax=Sphingomonas sp. 35-24ZXX TaxID=1545915 RepID=UPI000691F164|nr:type II secretion system protein GspL [Sphingomonas sp. 35-24ZXX]